MLREERIVGSLQWAVGSGQLAVEESWLFWGVSCLLPTAYCQLVFWLGGLEAG